MDQVVNYGLGKRRQISQIYLGRTDIGRPRPVNKQGFSLDQIKADRPPEAGIGTVIAIVAHSKDMVAGYPVGPKVDAAIIAAIGCYGAGIFAEGRIGIGFIIYIKNPVNQFDFLPSHSHAPLYVIGAAVDRILEDDDIPLSGFSDGRQLPIDDRYSGAIDEFIGHDEIADQKGVLHGRGWNLIGLNYQ